MSGAATGARGRAGPIALALVLSLASCPGARAQEPRAVALPDLSSSLPPLRVAHAVNPRLPRMDENAIAALLEQAREVVREHFGVEVEFSEPEAISVESLFALLPDRVVASRRRDIFDFKRGTGDVTRLVQAMRAGLVASMQINGTTLAEEYAFAEPYLLRKPASLELDGFARSLVYTMLRRLGGWRSRRALDGEPVIDDTPFNEWVLWDVLGYAELPYDLIITNQIVASAEYSGLAVHSSLRGGVTTGTTSYSRYGPYHTYIFFSTFPFASDFPELLALRDGDAYSRDESVELAGAYLAHELGHLLFHLGHPFGAQGCVMRPAEMLDFRGWRASLDATACPIGSHPAMTVGPARIFYDPGL